MKRAYAKPEIYMDVYIPNTSIALSCDSCVGLNYYAYSTTGCSRTDANQFYCWGEQYAGKYPTNVSYDICEAAPNGTGCVG